MRWINERWINESELESVNWHEYDDIGLSPRDGGPINLIYRGATSDRNRGDGAAPRRPLFIKMDDFDTPTARERVRRALDPEGTDVGWLTD